MAKVLHAADFHLDSAFRALPEEQARLRRQESRELPGRLVDWANDHGARLMLLAGDLFDSDQLYSQTAQMLAQALSRFRGTVVIAPGNHDWLSAASPYRQPIWPDNVHIFLGRGMERLALPELQCTVYGAAFTAPEEPESGLRGFYAQPDGSARIMVLHGDMGSRESRYRPLTPEEIAATGLDYLALGHVHAPSAMNRAGNTVWAYPGLPHTCIVKGDGKAAPRAGASTRPGSGASCSAMWSRDGWICALCPLQGGATKASPWTCPGATPWTPSAAACRRIPPGIFTASASPARRRSL